MTVQQSITCPVCSRTSHHPEDVSQGWCANCCGFTSSPDPVERQVAQEVARERWARLAQANGPAPVQGVGPFAGLRSWISGSGRRRRRSGGG